MTCEKQGQKFYSDDALLVYPDQYSASDWSSCVGNLLQPIGSATKNWVVTKVLARRVFSRPMDAHFWKKHKENSPNLLYVYGKTWILDGQFSMSG